MSFSSDFSDAWKDTKSLLATIAILTTALVGISFVLCGMKIECLESAIVGLVNIIVSVSIPWFATFSGVVLIVILFLFFLLKRQKVI